MLTASLSISDATVDEDAGTASFTITLNNPSGSASVDWATSNGTASAGSDYTSSSGTANLSTFNPSVNVSVPITNDSLKESGETFTVNLSNASGATISDGTGLGIINDNDEVELTRVFEKFYEGGELAHAGNVMSAYALPDGTSLIYNSLGNGQLILDLRTVQPDDSTVPSQIKADLTFDGSAVRTIYYSTSGLSAGDGLRFVFDVDVSSLASGVYEWELDLTETVGSHHSYRNFTGVAAVHDRTDSAFGNGWMVTGLDRLVVETDWVTVLFADGATAFYDRSAIQAGGGGGGGLGGGIGGGGGSGSGSLLVENTDGTFTYSHLNGGKANFNSSGRLVNRIDRNNNTMTYTYTGGGLLDEITFQDGRTVEFNYDGNSHLSGIVDNAGRTTSFSVDASGFLNSVTAPDPDGAGGQSAPVTTFTYNSANDILEEIEDALGNTTTYAFDDYDRVESVTNALMQTYTVSPQIVDGLIPSGSGTSGSPAALPDTSPVGTITDPLSHDYSVAYDSFGLSREATDENGNVTTWDRNDKGYITEITLPDPDGAGGQSAPVTSFTLDTANNVTGIVFPDTSDASWTYDATWNIPTEYIDPMGNKTVYTINSSNGNVTTIRQVVGQVDDFVNGETDDVITTLTYTSDPTAQGQLPGGLLLTVTDPKGYVTKYNYGTTSGTNSFARITSVVTAYGTGLASTTSFTYDAAGNVLTVTDPVSRTTTYTYDNLGRLIEVEAPDPDGAGSQTAAETTFAYDAVGNLTSVTDPLGNVTTYAYDDLNRLTTTTSADPDGAGSLTSLTTVYAYDAAGRVSTFTDTLGSVTTYAYDSLNRLTSVTYPDPDGAGAQASPVESYTYDNLGRVITATDPLGKVTSIAYDVMSRMTELTLPDPDGAGSQTSPVWDWTYNDAGQVSQVTNPLSGVTDYDYDALGRLISVELPDPDGAGPLSRPETNYAYDKASNLTGATAPNGATTSYSYDQKHRLIEITLPSPGGMGPPPASTIEFAYNLADQLTTRTDSLGQDTDYDYDDAGRLDSITYPDPDGAGSQSSPVASYVYDTAGRVIEWVDPLGNSTLYDFDNLGRLIERTDPDPDGAGGLSAPVTTYNFSSVGLLASLVDASSNTTSWTYDALGRVLTETNELSDTKTYEYDAASQLTKVTDRNGRVTELNYDFLGRLTSEVWKSGGSTVRTLSYGYDAMSQLTSASDPDAAYEFTYDAIGQLTQEDIDYGSGINEFRLLSEYDSYGNRTELALSVDSGSGYIGDILNVYSYDGMSRMTSIVQKGVSGGATVNDKRVDIQYTSDSRFAEITRYNSETASSGNLVAESFYTYDDLGRLITLDHEDGSSAIATYDFSYDAFSRIEEIVATASTGLAGTSQFTYDDTGQLIDVDHTHITDESYSFDETGNRTMSGYTTGDANRMSSDGTFNYVYDDEGNLVTRTRISSAAADDKTTEYSWDHRNRLVSITYKNNSSVVTKNADYTYDIFDRRIAKEVDADGAGGGAAVVTRYVYDGSDILVTTDASGDVETRYLHGPAVDQVFAAEDASSGDTLWALTDHLGSVRDIVDDTGSVENHIVYDSFGRVVSETTPAVDLLFGFTGRERDEESGLNYHRARYYDPSIGRWISEDPISFAGGDENIYCYVGNDGVNFTDPTGLWEEATESQSTDDAGQFEQEFERPLRSALRSCMVCHNPVIVGGEGTIDDLPEHFQQAAMEWLHADTPEEASNRIVLMQEAEETVVTGVPGIVLEPYDWVMTALEISDDPTNPWSYAGLLPFVPAVAGKLAKKADNVIPPAGIIPPTGIIPGNPNPGGPGFRSIYSDGLLVVDGQQPPRLPRTPDPDASGVPHSRVREDEVNQRVYQLREFDVDGNIVRDIDMTNPTYPNGTPRPGHPGPPHQHIYTVNDPRVGPKSGTRRGGPEPVEGEL